MKNTIITIIGILVALSILVLLKNSQKTIAPSFSVSKNVLIPTPTPDKNLLTYSDDSGFAFQYPEGVSVNKKPLSSNLLYSSLELIATGSVDVVTVKAEESSLQTIDDFFKGSSKTSVYGEVKKVKLADLDGRQFEANNIKTTIALDQGVLFTVSTNAKKDTFLMKTYEKILGSFTFVQPTQSSSNSDDSGGYSDVIEEEEVLE